MVVLAANVWKKQTSAFFAQARSPGFARHGMGATANDEMISYVARAKRKTVIKKWKNNRIKHRNRRSPSRCKHNAFGNGGRAPANAPVLRVGADCAGLNLGCVALEILGVRPNLIFASEKDKATRAMTKHNFPIARGGMCPDIMSRDDATLAAVDIYTAAPPCQSFPTARKKMGLRDARGCVFLRVLSTIKIVMPACFILENVPGLKTIHKELYAHILYFLQHIEDPDGKWTYKVRTKVLNSLEVGWGTAEPSTCLHCRLEACLGDSRILVAGSHPAETLEPPFKGPRGGGAPGNVRPLAPSTGQRRRRAATPHQQTPGGSIHV